MSSFILKKCNQRVFDDVAHSVVVDVGVVIVHVLVRERLHDIHSKVYTLVEVVFFDAEIGKLLRNGEGDFVFEFDKLVVDRLVAVRERMKCLVNICVFL